jgi:FkbH-like protein
MKYSELITTNRQLAKRVNTPPYNIAILSNIVVHPIIDFVEYACRIMNINATAIVGDYDNIIQDSQKYCDYDATIIFWELCNLTERIHYKIELFNDEQINILLDKTKSEIDYVLSKLNKTSLVIFNKFTSFPFSRFSPNINKLEQFSKKLNQHLLEKAPPNVKIIDLEGIFASIGIYRSIDFRFYYSSKALYTIDFYKSYVDHIIPSILAINGKAKKVLVFDCDNTLWKGIIGEDGYQNIEMSERTKSGAIFAEIQGIALSLNKSGVLLGLCTKNNYQDIEEVIKHHPDMKLRMEQIAIIKCNWDDKVSNLLQIALELNVGLDSIVFIDDSAFEINLIKEHLPEVTVLQVPERLYYYPELLRENLGLFYNLSNTKEDLQRAEMYKQQEKRESLLKKYTNVEDYLTSLGLEITVYEDDQSIVSRLSQLTQKTNQFNLTTKRYSEVDIMNFISSSDSKVLAFNTNDKFGDSGITGLCIIRFDKIQRTALIDTFLMSCRIIGRNIEYAFLDFIIDILKKNKTSYLKANYIRTPKNEQVNNFYDSCSFSLIKSDSNIKEYNLWIKDYKPKRIEYITINYGK